MIFVYEPKTGRILHAVEVGHVEKYKEMLDVRGDAYLEAEAYKSPLDLLRLYVKDGKLYLREEMPISPPTRMKVGVEATFSGVPAGVAIRINDQAFGAMDNSGTLEFTPQNAGTYRFGFAGGDYMMKEISIEALP